MPEDFQYNQNAVDLDTELEGIMESQQGGPTETAGESFHEEDAPESGLERIARGDLPSTDVENTVAQSTPSVDEAFREHEVRGMLRNRQTQDLAGKAAVHTFLQTVR